MKIINDKSLIGYRVALQSRLIAETGDFALFISELQERLKKFPLNMEELVVMYEKIVTLCGLYYEIAFGSYFAKKDAEFKERIYRNLVSKYSELVFDHSIDNVEEKVGIQIYIDMEMTLKEEINQQKNGEQPTSDKR
jgi:hypothetical protein